MKKIIHVSLVAMIAAFTSAFTVLETANWSLDSAHAKIGFSLTHLMVSDVEGNFKNFSAGIKSTKADFSDAVVEFSADASSITTENAQRDAHIKGADFLDVEKYPKVTFKSTSFKPGKTKGTYLVKGLLNMHGVSKAVNLQAVARTGLNPMMKKQVAGFKINGTIKRADFGIGASVPTAVVGDEISINANAEFLKD